VRPALSPWLAEHLLTFVRRAVFGFVASLMERIPLVGLVFSISNRIGAAMWAHDVSLLPSSPSFFPR